MGLLSSSSVVVFVGSLRSLAGPAALWSGVRGVVVISARGGGLRALAWPHGSEGDEELGVTNEGDEGLSVEGVGR